MWVFWKMLNLINGYKYNLLVLHLVTNWKVCYVSFTCCICSISFDYACTFNQSGKFITWLLVSNACTSVLIYPVYPQSNYKPISVLAVPLVEKLDFAINIHDLVKSTLNFCRGAGGPALQVGNFSMFRMWQLNYLLLPYITKIYSLFWKI